MNVELGSRFITLPRRGLRVSMPLTSMEVIDGIRANGMDGRGPVWTETEKARLRLIRDCKILRRRYPTPEDGRQFMSAVDHQRRFELFGMATELSSHIVEKWTEINPDTPIAVLLFGSVSKGLVKHPDHPDPSNIDLAVIGEFNEDERLALLDAIRPKRIEVGKAIRKGCTGISSPEKNPGNAGVIVHRACKVKNCGDYSPALNYIASEAVALHDPSGVWKTIENEALLFAAEKFRKQVEKRLERLGRFSKA